MWVIWVEYEKVEYKGEQKMAERRMFAKTIIGSDAFIDMPLSTQALYFHLSMRADDEGFINNPRKIQRMIGAADDDLKVLITKKFIIPFESGIVVIKHWKIHNYIQKDRFKETMYLEEKAMLETKENKGYTLKQEECIQVGYIMDTQDRIELGKSKVSIEKDNIYSPAKAEPNIPYKEIIEYLNNRIGTNYRHTTNKTKDLIKARFNEGFSLDDFKEVIDKKCSEWMNTDMEKYLRPETLFGTKFENYLNQQVKQRKLTTKDIQDKIDISDF